MTTKPKPLPPRFRRGRANVDAALLEVRSSDPKRYADRLAVGQTMLNNAERWRSEPVKLPRAVEVVEMLDKDGRTVHAIEWGTTPPPAPFLYFDDRAVAVEVVWTAFRLKRPWAIDDDRLAALVANPPAPHSWLLARLLSIFFAHSIRAGFATFTQACIDTPFGDPDELHALLVRCTEIRDRYDARAMLAVHELSALLDVEEPDAGLGDEAHRWRWLLLDYVQLWDPALHNNVMGLSDRFSSAEPSEVPQAWHNLCALRQIDASVGVLLARATMLEPPTTRHPDAGFVDPMSTLAVGSFAWACRWLVEALEDTYELGERLKPKEVDLFLRFAAHKLGEEAPEVRASLERLFPVVPAQR